MSTLLSMGDEPQHSNERRPSSADETLVFATERRVPSAVAHLGWLGDPTTEHPNRVPIRPWFFPDTNSTKRIFADQVRRLSTPFDRSAVALFWSRVALVGDCWEWQGKLQPDGYARVRFDERFWQAHRLAWTLTRGDVPERLCVCHHCDNRKCVRPSHMFLGSPADNAIDAMAKGRLWKNGAPAQSTLVARAYKARRAAGLTRVYTCSVCGGSGHNRQTCSNQPGDT